MLRVFQRSGLPLVMGFVDGLHEVRITLRPALKERSTVGRHAVALLRRRFARHFGDKVGV